MAAPICKSQKPGRVFLTRGIRPAGLVVQRRVLARVQGQACATRIRSRRIVRDDTCPQVLYDLWVICREVGGLRGIGLDIKELHRFHQEGRSS